MTNWSPPPAAFDPEAAFRHAAALCDRGDLGGAEKVYRLILKRHPDNFNTLYNLAGVLWRMERFEESLRFLRKALNRKPNEALAHALMAGVQRSLGRYDEAEERARRAIALKPDFAEAHDGLARILADIGRHDEALEAQARAVELAPGVPRYYFHLGDLAVWTSGDPRLATLEKIRLAPERLSPDEQVYLNFTLAKAHADCGDIERSFRRQIDGGALKRRLLRYDEAAALGEMEALCRACDGAWLRRHSGVGDASTLPVFILGMPRSGSTLVEQILVSHPEVGTLGETETLVTALGGLAGSGAAGLEQAIAKCPESELRKMGTRYVEAARRGTRQDAERICDKTPGNFRLVGLIHAALPNARIIHISRNPLDTCLSIFSTLFWGGNQPYSYELGELGRYYRAYQAMMAHWHAVLPPGGMLEVRYEDIVEDMEQQARRIIAHCNLEWHNDCLAFDKTDRPVRTASHAQVRKPIYRGALRRPRAPAELLEPLRKELDISI